MAHTCLYAIKLKSKILCWKPSIDTNRESIIPMLRGIINKLQHLPDCNAFSFSLNQETKLHTISNYQSTYHYNNLKNMLKFDIPINWDINLNCILISTLNVTSVIIIIGYQWKNNNWKSFWFPYVTNLTR